MKSYLYVQIALLSVLSIILIFIVIYASVSQLSKRKISEKNARNLKSTDPSSLLVQLNSMMNSSTEHFLRSSFMPQIYESTLQNFTYRYTYHVSNFCTLFTTAYNIGLDTQNNLLKPTVQYSNLIMKNPSTSECTMLIVALFPRIPVSLTYDRGSCPVVLDGPSLAYVNYVQMFIQINFTLMIAPNNSTGGLSLTASKFSGQSKFLADSSPLQVEAIGIKTVTIDLADILLEFVNGSDIQQKLKNSISGLPDFAFQLAAVPGIPNFFAQQILVSLLENPDSVYTFKPSFNSIVTCPDWNKQATITSVATKELCASSCLDNCVLTVFNAGRCASSPFLDFSVPQVTPGAPNVTARNRWLFNGKGYLWPDINQYVALQYLDSPTTVFIRYNNTNGLVMQKNNSSSIDQYWGLDNQKQLTLLDQPDNTSYGFVFLSNQLEPRILSPGMNTVSSYIGYENIQTGTFGNLNLYTKQDRSIVVYLNEGTLLPNMIAKLTIQAPYRCGSKNFSFTNKSSYNLWINTTGIDDPLHWIDVSYGSTISDLCLNDPNGTTRYVLYINNSPTNPTIGGSKKYNLEPISTIPTNEKFDQISLQYNQDSDVFLLVTGPLGQIDRTTTNAPDGGTGGHYTILASIDGNPDLENIELDDGSSQIVFRAYLDSIAAVLPESSWITLRNAAFNWQLNIWNNLTINIIDKNYDSSNWTIQILPQN